ncbi:hypothetical protein [Streptomyces phaeoluteigriseus]
MPSSPPSSPSGRQRSCIPSPLPADIAPIRQALTDPDPAQAAITALLAFHALRALEIRHLTLTDARDLAAGHLHLPGGTVTLAEPVRVSLAACLAHRSRRWPNTANPHFFVTMRTALSTTPVSTPWLYRQHPDTADVLRSDRIVDESRPRGATSGGCATCSASPSRPPPATPLPDRTPTRHRSYDAPPTHAACLETLYEAFATDGAPNASPLRRVIAVLEGCPQPGRGPRR